MWPAAVSMQCINMLVSTQWLWLSETYQSTQEKSLPGHRLASTPAESAQVGWQLSLINLEMVSCYHRQFSTFQTFKQLDSLQTNEKKSNWEKFLKRYKNGNISFLNARSPGFTGYMTIFEYNISSIPAPCFYTYAQPNICRLLRSSQLDNVKLSTYVKY